MKLTDSRESEFPPTPQNVLLILKFHYKQHPASVLEKPDFLSNQSGCAKHKT